MLRTGAYRIATIALRRPVHHVPPLLMLPLDTYSGWHNQSHSFRYNCTAVCSSSTAKVQWLMVYFLEQPDEAVCSHPCQFGPANANAPNVTAQSSECNPKRLQIPN